MDKNQRPLEETQNVEGREIASTALHLKLEILLFGVDCGRAGGGKQGEGGGGGGGGRGGISCFEDGDTTRSAEEEICKIVDTTLEVAISSGIEMEVTPHGGESHRSGGSVCDSGSAASGGSHVTYTCEQPVNASRHACASGGSQCGVGTAVIGGLRRFGNEKRQSKRRHFRLAGVCTPDTGRLPLHLLVRYTRARTCTDTHTRTRTHTYIHTHEHARTHTHTQTHTQTHIHTLGGVHP